jgi:hypothetical protein
MGLLLEWRSKAEGEDTILAVEDDTYTVRKVWKAEPAILTDFLNDMVGFKAPAKNHESVHEPTPEEWGELVIARSESGDVLTIDPQLYWEGISYWFRARGNDPHQWRGRR